MTVAAVLCLTNSLLSWWSRYLNTDDPPLSVELTAGYLFYPIAFLLGVERNGDLLKVSQLIGINIVANELVAFGTMTRDPTYVTLSARSRLIATNQNPAPKINCTNRLKSHAYHVLQLHDVANSVNTRIHLQPLSSSTLLEIAKRLRPKIYLFPTRDPSCLAGSRRYQIYFLSCPMESERKP